MPQIINSFIKKLHLFLPLTMILCYMLSCTRIQDNEKHNIISELSDEEQTSAEILITNPGKLVNAKYIDNTSTRLWRTLPYETENISGVMICESGGPDLPSLTIPLKIKGKYRILLGMYNGEGLPQIQVRLSKDSSLQKISLRKTCNDDGYTASLSIYEVYWKDADLSGQNLILESNNHPSIQPGGLAYIRLQPIEKITKTLSEDNPPLVITDDGNGIFGEYEHTKPQDLLKYFELIPKESNLSMLIWGIGVGDMCNYPTNVGNFFTPYNELLAPFRARYLKNAELWKTKKWNSLELMRNYTRERGWEFQVYIRMQGFGTLYPYDKYIKSEFYNMHPEYHCLDRQGREVSRLSYAYPEVQQHMLNLIKEIAGYGPDGINLCFVRGVPLVLYEPIMVDGFKKKYRIDPRNLAETDARWMDYQAVIVTEFVEKVKNALKENQRLSVMVPGNERDCKRWGLDVAKWVERGIIDDLLPVGQYFDERDVHRDAPDSLDFSFFAQLRGRDNIRLIPMFYTWTMFNKDYQGWLQLYRKFLDMGADAYCVWDGCSERVFDKVNNIGYKNKSDNDIYKISFKRVKLITVQGLRVDRYHYFEGV